MSDGILTLLLPVVWAVVATLIGLLLYKSSSALFESEKTTEVGTRRIRLVGSVVIAALAFWGMQQSTPRERLQDSRNSEIAARDQRIVGSSRRIFRLAQEISACVDVRDVQDCHSHAQDIMREAEMLISFTTDGIEEVGRP